ncbi:hypothetical protein [Nitratireductor luteus]|uniref:hypothetical protein n=1 Tax=Nitratireductor luteus TaxID=2976980 RepID=UPI00223EDFC3|nr:hypothetical protein [Nitratireductor luteus]
MIDLYFSPTPNGLKLKLKLFFEETGHIAAGSCATGCIWRIAHVALAHTAGYKQPQHRLLFRRSDGSVGPKTLRAFLLRD